MFAKLRYESTCYGGSCVRIAGGVINVLYWIRRGIPKLEKFYKQTIEPIGGRRLALTRLESKTFMPKNEIVEKFMLEIADAGAEVPLYYRVGLPTRNVESILEVLEGKYGKFKELPAVGSTQVRKYIENGSEFLIYYYRKDSVGTVAELHFINLDNISQYIPAKLEKIKAQKASSDDAAKKAAKDLF